MFHRTGFLLLVAVVCGIFGANVTPQAPTNLDKDGGRLVGGTDIDIAGAPYQLTIMHQYAPSKCGGSIINTKAVLTAAQCFVEPHEGYYILYGVNKLNDDPENIIEADKVVIHEAYNPSTMDYDIAFVFLKEEIPYSILALPIGLAKENPVFGASVRVTGWGGLGENEYAAETLQAVDLFIKPNIVCYNQYKDEPSVGKVTNRNLCAGLDCGGKGACQGDSGGPMTYNDKLVGLFSWGIDCGNPKYSGVYTSVPALYAWIEKTLKYNQCSWISIIFGLCGALHD